jgi:hypothetical protein
MPRSIIIDGVEIKQCNGCNQLLDIINFNRNKRTPDGYNYRCKKCSHLSKTPEIYITTSREMLEAMGYDTDPNNPISVHKQFLMKHNLNK